MSSTLNKILRTKILEVIHEIDKNELEIFIKKFMPDYKNKPEEVTFQDIINYGRKNSGNLPDEVLSDKIHEKIIHSSWRHHEELPKETKSDHHRVLTTVMKKK